MNFFESFIYFLQNMQMNTPVRFGWFHFMWLLFVFVAVCFIFIKKKYNEKDLKLVLGVYGITAFILELLKQLIWSFNLDSVSNLVSWDYTWYAAPFQLCTMPIYVCLICLFLKKCKFRDYLLSFIAFVTILGSISTMILPDSCFVSDTLVNVHTMWLHMGSFVVSVYLIISKEVKLEILSVKKAWLVFLNFVGVALLLNIGIYKSGILNGETFNMFYISPYFVSSLPIFNIIQENVPYILFLLIYVVALMLGAFIIYLICKFISIFYKKMK